MIISLNYRKNSPERYVRVGTQQSFLFPNVYTFLYFPTILKRGMCSFAHSIIKSFKFPLIHFVRFLDISKRITPRNYLPTGGAQLLPVSQIWTTDLFLFGPLCVFAHYFVASIEM